MDEGEIFVIPITDKYTALFGSGMGREVLADILISCNWGVTLDPNDPGQIGVYNAGLVIAGKAGLLDQIDLLLGIMKGQ